MLTKNYANIKTNESRQQEVESEFYEVKKNGQIFSVRAIFAYDKNYNFLSLIFLNCSFILVFAFIIFS